MNVITGVMIVRLDLNNRFLRELFLTSLFLTLAAFVEGDVICPTRKDMSQEISKHMIVSNFMMLDVISNREGVHQEKQFEQVSGTVRRTFFKSLFMYWFWGRQGLVDIDLIWEGEQLQYIVSRVSSYSDNTLYLNDPLGISKLLDESVIDPDGDYFSRSSWNLFSGFEGTGQQVAERYKKLIPAFLKWHADLLEIQGN